MKKTIISAMILLGTVLTVLPTMATTVTVVANNSSGINRANYTATLSDGTVLGFYISSSYVYFCGAISSASSIEVPGTLTLGTGSSKYTVRFFGYSSDYHIDFDEATNLTEITLPAEITDINSYVPIYISDLHLNSTTRPSCSRNFISSHTTVWVPQNLYSVYQEAANDNGSRWFGCDILYEGWTPKSYTVNVRSAGSFANEMLKIVDKWADVDELTVTGTLNQNDMDVFSRMTNLRKLDLSQTDITYVGGCGNLTKLATVLLPSTVISVGGEAFSNCRLREINLPNATSIDYGAFYNCSLKELSLPNARTIGGSAFSGCRLQTLSLPNVVTIGSFAFSGNTSLATVDAQKLEIVEDGAFSGCSKLSVFDFKNIKQIGYSAFQGCSSLKSVDLSNVETLGANRDNYDYRYDNGTFYGCTSLSSVQLSSKLTSIPSGCFAECSSLREISIPESIEGIGSYVFYGTSISVVDLPEGLKKIGEGTFYYCPLTDISIPSTVESLGSNAFYTELLQNVYCYAVVPPSTSNFQNVSAATLHVPAFSMANYRLHDGWYQFGRTVAIDSDISRLSINSDFTLYEYTGLADKVDLTLGMSAHMTVDAVNALNIGSFRQDLSITGEDYNYDDFGNRVYYGVSTFIAKNEINADGIELHIRLKKDRWNFVSFPFDVNVSDIKMPEGTLWVVRKYSGADRAAMTGNTWQNMTDGMVLNAGEGYIVHCTNESAGWNEGIEMVVKSMDNDNKNSGFVSDDVTRVLNEYPSEYAHNRSWNLIGNPYPSYYYTPAMEIASPITVWNGNGYTAYSLLDDYYTLRPYEAFFVQCPSNSNIIKFSKEGRSHEDFGSSDNNESGSRVVASALGRQVINIMLADNEYTDKTRIVINENAKAEYESECDASKFMSSNKNVPQIYVVDGNLHYAIDERPIGNGTFALGTYFGKDGEYTISLNTKNVAGRVVLTDRNTGDVTDLMTDSYTFSAYAGTNDGRFSIAIENDFTGIKNTEAVDNDESDMFDMSGRRANEYTKGIVVKGGKKILK